MIMKKIAILLFSLVFLSISTLTVYAYDGLIERVSGIPQVISPLSYVEDDHMNKYVGSSWNEPRVPTDSVHRGVDQSCPIHPNMSVCPMNLYPVTGSIYQLDTNTSCGNFQVIKYVYSGVTFYSLYMHLKEWDANHPVGSSVTASDITATSGNTGPDETPYHLHFELLSQYTKTTGLCDAERKSLNPANYVTCGNITSDTLYKFSVFKNYRETYNSAEHTCRVEIDGVDTSLNVYRNIANMYLYYRKVGTSSWSYTNMSPVSGHGSAYILGNVGDTYELFIAGVRSTGEYWATYPAKYTTELGNSDLPSTSGLTFNMQNITIR